MSMSESAALDYIAVLEAVARAHYEARHCGVVAHQLVPPGGHAYLAIRGEVDDADPLLVYDCVDTRKRDYRCEAK
ncbi:MAG: hypothetical protein M1522_02315 [Actinobacteria bacterium]|nr:hypothetical protein [Actinomycetota bacterium]